jgi:FAD-dependent oxidoreductase domain-containing protein 1
MAETWDVVIVGGGVIGGAVAYFLAADPAFRGSVLVVERDPTYAAASTSLSVGSIRQQFSTPENIRMSRFGAEFVQRIGEHLAVDGEAPDVSWHEGGYLFLATAAGVPVLEANHRVQRENGARNVLLSPAELAARFPWLAAHDLAMGSLGLAGEGWLDPYALLQAFRRKARALGVRFRHDEVVGIERAGGRVAGAHLGSGDVVACGALVDAAGPRAGMLAALAGIALPVRPRKRFVYVFDCRTKIACNELVIDPSGVYFRPEGRHYLGGVSPPAEADPDCLDLEIDETLFEEVVWPTLARRVPAFEAVKLVRAWAGHYDYNVFDQNAVLGSHPELGNFYFANGFSGHGVQQAPAAGRAVAELIAHGGYRTLDLRRFGFERIVSGEPLREINVV